MPLAYLAAVVAVALLRSVSGHPAVGALALTPDRLAAGRVWLLATSAAVVNGPVVPQVAALAVTLAPALVRLGPRLVTLTMATAHVGATLLAYALLLAATGDPDGSRNAGFDYGISAVWLGLLGALAVALVPVARGENRRALAAIAAALMCVIVGVIAFPLMAATEHGLAFAIGAALATLTEQRRRGSRSARYAASTASGPTAAA